MIQCFFWCQALWSHSLFFIVIACLLVVMLWTSQLPCPFCFQLKNYGSFWMTFFEFTGFRQGLIFPVLVWAVASEYSYHNLFPQYHGQPQKMWGEYIYFCCQQNPFSLWKKNKEFIIRQWLSFPFVSQMPPFHDHYSQGCPPVSHFPPAPLFGWEHSPV